MLIPWLIAPTWTLKIYLSLVLLASPIAFALYGFDKRRARRQGRRVSEATLQIAAFVGGWPGAWLGQVVFRHKTSKWRFRMLFWLIVAAHGSFLLIMLAGLVLR